MTENSLEPEYSMILATGLFNEACYRQTAQLDASLDAVIHYLQHGWRTGASFNPEFDDWLLGHYFESAGFNGPPLLTFAMLKAAGWPVFCNRNELEFFARVLRSSAFFDEQFYRRHGMPSRPDLDAAYHYLIAGERLGLSASPEFNATYYSERNPDVRNAALNYLCHFISNGQNEGRSGRPVADDFPLDLTKFSPSKETIILVSHDASRTGAPILALNIGQRFVQKYNIVVVLMRGGALVRDFEKIASHLIVLNERDRNDIELKYFVQSVVRSVPVRFAMVNSIESRDINKHLAAVFVPVVMLVHEFSSYTRPLDSLRRGMNWATEIVFSAQIVLESALVDNPGLADRDCKIIPQGLCSAIDLSRTEKLSGESERLKNGMRPSDAYDSFVVLGAGSLHIRKGIDLFLMTAAEMLRKMPEIAVRFVWIGHGYDPGRDMSYSVYIHEQIVRSGLQDQVIMLDEVSDIEKAYTMADAFFLSSRLDPLPNVTIDASIHGLPIVCFEGASGMAQILKLDPVAQQCVAPYLDIQTAAAIIANLAKDSSFRKTVSAATETLGRKKFDMGRYIEQLEDVGQSAVEAIAQRSLDFFTIRDDQFFDPAIFLPAASNESRDDAIKRFLGYWSATLMFASPLEIQSDFRRPAAGFHPQIYAEHHGLDRGINPLADFIRRKYPAGPWTHEVFKPGLRSIGSGRGSRLRVAVHAHFHYPELIDDFLRKLQFNEQTFDLLLTTDTQAKANELEAATAAFDRGRVLIRVGPNRGRDIGPFLTGFGKEILRGYDIVGHFHGKRSLSIDGDLGSTWREFLWQHLIGDIYPMMDLIVDLFAEQDRLGLVFAEEPHLVGWTKNLSLAQTIATDMGIDQPLPRFHEFPVGTMFWARTAALDLMINLNLDWDDYPAEPIADDGTILHALERMLPLVAQQAGFTFLTTYIEGITR